MRSNRILTTILAALAAATTDAKPLERAPRSSRHVVHERAELGGGGGAWERSHRLHQTATLPVRIGLTQQNLHRAEEFVYGVADPASPNYGRHWSPAEVVEMFKPRKEAVDAVMAWLGAEGIHPGRVRLSASKTWLAFNASAREVEQMLRTEYHVYKHAAGGARHVACEQYHVPEHLVEHIDIVTPTVHFDQRVGRERTGQKEPVGDAADLDELRRKRENDKRTAAGGSALEKRGRPFSGIVGKPSDATNPKQGASADNAMMSLAQCDSMITPGCLRALYNMPKGSLAASNNTLGIVEYTPQAFLQSDLDEYFKQFQPKLQGVSPEVRLLDNAVVQQQNKSFSFNGESALDLEYAMTLIYPQQATVYQVGDIVQGASFNNFLDGIDGSYCTFEGGDSKNPNIDGQYSAAVECGVTTPTNVISTSYGSDEAGMGPKYEERQCAEYMKLALQGVSVIYSSGDFGVAGNGGACLAANGSADATNDGASGKFNPSFPGGCPWVTSVGATQLRNGSTVADPEAACERVIFSGGGFSNVFAMPSYQKPAVARYYAQSPPPYGADLYNNSRVVRGYPDVSVNGANYVTAVDGQFSLSYGTSASAPVFASMINMINEKRIQAGKKPVGFVNPALYANPQVMNDIKIGNNPGCGTKGFEAVPGWDPLTGLGTPDFTKMQELFLTLP